MRYSKEESAGLLEPWIGSGLALNDLPIPRMIVVRVAPGETPDFASLRQKLAAQIPGATLDDHRGWIDRMRAMARNAALAGLAVLALVFAATMLSVMFATRGAMSTNRQIIEVLHVVGARRDFIAGEFQRHFLLLGLKGGAIGGGVAMVLFALIGLLSDWFKGGARADDACSAISRSGPQDTARSSGSWCWSRRDGGDLAADRAPHPADDGMTVPCRPCLNGPIVAPGTRR